MELRSGRCLRSSPPPHGARRLTSPRGVNPQPGPGGEVDRISALPDEMLLQVLARLGCTRAAVHTTLLSSRWRGLWTAIPEATFVDLAPGPLHAALASLRPGLDLLNVIVDLGEVDSGRASSLLRAAARLSSLRLHISVLAKPSRVGVDLPCFDRAVSISLSALHIRIAAPPPGAFPALERLCLFYCGIDFAALIPACPRLRVLCARSMDLEEPSTYTIHSDSLEELDVSMFGYTARIDIVAPNLKHLEFDASICFPNLNTHIISAPVLEKLSWNCRYQLLMVAGQGVWTFLNMSLETHKCLSLEIGAAANHPYPNQRSFAQEVQKLPAVDFSVLKLGLQVKGTGHIFGPIVLHLLRINRIRTATRKLEVILKSSEHQDITKACQPGCPCDEPKDCRTQTVSLTSIEEVEIEGFHGGDDNEFDFLKLIFGCTPMLRRMTVSGVKISDGGCSEIYKVFKEYPSDPWSAILTSVLDQCNTTMLTHKQLRWSFANVLNL